MDYQARPGRWPRVSPRGPRSRRRSRSGPSTGPRRSHSRRPSSTRPHCRVSPVSQPITGKALRRSKRNGARASQASSASAITLGLMTAPLSRSQMLLTRAWPGRLTRDLRWLLVVAVTAYLLYITRNWRFPNSSGISFPGLWAALVVGSCIAWRVARGRFGPIEYLALLAAWGMVLGDVTQFWSQAFRDLHIYVKAGEHFLDGQPIYMTEILRQRPDDLSNYPYLYPPL